MNVVSLELPDPFEEAKVVMVTPADALKIWPEIERFAKEALAHAFDDMTSEEVLGWILSDRLLLLVITVDDRIVGAATLEIVDKLSGRVCHCMTFAGDDLETWESAWMDIWERVAREYGCNQITIKGREGWGRYARQRLGFSHVYTMMVKSLED